MNKTYLGFCAALLLASTAHAALSALDKTTAAEIAKSTEVKRDNFKKTTTVETDGIRYIKSKTSLDMSTYWLFASLKDGDAQVEFSVFVETIRPSEKDWANWHEAFDDGGEKFPLNREDAKAVPVKSLGQIALREIANAKVTREYLEKAKAKPLVWKIYGQNCDENFTITANLVEGFLLKCDKVLGPKLAKAAPKEPKAKKNVSAEGL